MGLRAHRYPRGSPRNSAVCMCWSASYRVWRSGDHGFCGGFLAGAYACAVVDPGFDNIRFVAHVAADLDELRTIALHAPEAQRVGFDGQQFGDLVCSQEL